MKYAPIMICTLNRSKHFIDCVNSLQANTHASKTDLYISVDYPPSENYVKGHNEILSFLRDGLEGFHRVFVFYQKENLGVVGNGRFLREKVFEDNDRYIMTEDDNVFSPCFLDYIYKGFYFYEGDDSVIALCGHSYSIKWPDKSRKIDKINTLFDGWGVGRTRENYLKMRKYIENNMEKCFREKKCMRNLYNKQEFLFQCAENYSRGIVGDMAYNGKIRMMDQTIGMYMIFEEKYTIMPHISLVRNMGDDGSGVHGGENPSKYSWATQEIDQGDTFDFPEDDISYDTRLDRCLNRFFALGLKARVKNRLRLAIMK